MKFNKKQKKELKKLGFWKKVKKTIKQSKNYRGATSKHTTLANAFYWANTKDGIDYWRELEHKLKNKIKDK